MQQGIKPNKKAAAVFWILTALVLGLIFFFSAQNADESTVQSNFIIRLLSLITGDDSISDFIVRKAAHFCEFALLCFLFSFSFLYTYGRPKWILSLALTSAYAATDEFHQRFVEGRACQVMDWTIDSAGALAGLAAFAIIIWCCSKRMK